MTVQNVIVKNIADGNGVNKQWPFTFACPVDHPEFVKVFIKDASGNVSQTQDYTVNMQSKYVTYPVAGSVLQKGERIIIARELPLHQILNLVNQGPFFAEALEATYDELVMMVQQLNEQLGRSLKVGIDIDQTKEIDVIMPVPTDQGNYGIRITKDGFSLVPDLEDILRETIATKDQVIILKRQTEAAAREAATEAVAEVSTQLRGEFDNVLKYTVGIFNDTVGVYDDTVRFTFEKLQTIRNIATEVETNKNETVNAATSAQRSAHEAETEADKAMTGAQRAAASAGDADMYAGHAAESAEDANRDATYIRNNVSTIQSDISSLKSGKQDKLTAGVNIEIVDNVISATGGGGGGTEEVYVGATEPTSADIKMWVNPDDANEVYRSVTLTQAQYDALGTVNPHTIYYIIEEGV